MKRKVMLEFDGDWELFKKAMDTDDGYFDLIDSIFWQIDHGDGSGSTHHTECGDIKITTVSKIVDI